MQHNFFYCYFIHFHITAGTSDIHKTESLRKKQFNFNGWRHTKLEKSALSLRILITLYANIKNVPFLLSIKRIQHRCFVGIIMANCSRFCVLCCTHRNIRNIRLYDNLTASCSSLTGLLNIRFTFHIFFTAFAGKGTIPIVGIVMVLFCFLKMILHLFRSVFNCPACFPHNRIKYFTEFLHGRIKCLRKRFFLKISTGTGSGRLF